MTTDSPPTLAPRLHPSAVLRYPWRDQGKALDPRRASWYVVTADAEAAIRGIVPGYKAGGPGLDLLGAHLRSRGIDPEPLSLPAALDLLRHEPAQAKRRPPDGPPAVARALGVLVDFPGIESVRAVALKAECHYSTLYKSATFMDAWRKTRREPPSRGIKARGGGVDASPGYRRSRGRC